MVDWDGWVDKKKSVNMQIIIVKVMQSKHQKTNKTRRNLVNVGKNKQTAGIMAVGILRGVNECMNECYSVKTFFSRERE